MKIKLFDVFYVDRLHRPRGLVVEIREAYLTLLTEGGGQDYIKLPPSKWRLMDVDEWDGFADHLADDIPPRMMREVKEAARATFEWPMEWIEFKARYDATGNAFIDPAHGPTFAEWPPQSEA